MSVLLLVRHGQASWGTSDYDRLSDVGLRQSALVGESMASRRIEPSLLVTGAMRRHWQTLESARAEARWSTPAVEDVGWNEFDHLQVLDRYPAAPSTSETMTRQEFQRWFVAAVERWVSGLHDADYDETFAEFCERVTRALTRTLEALGPGETGVVFSSGGPLAWAISSLLDGDAALWRRVNTVMANASITKVVSSSRATTLVSMNEHAHLEPDLITYR